MRCYASELSSFLQNDKTQVNAYGVPVLTKAIPDDARPGRIDPRELEILQDRAAQSIASEVRQAEPSIQEIRDQMGFPNLNMNTVEIYTRYEEHTFEGNRVAIWIYYPRKPAGKKGRAGFIYLHGGGWMGGTPFTVENPCKLLVERADCVVFNIDYSLAPEKPYPNGLDDCFNAVKHIYANAEQYQIDRQKIGIGGDSAGGNLAAVCALRDRDMATHMLNYQALIYPAVTFVSDGVPGYRWQIEDYEMDPEQRELIDPMLSIGRPVEHEGSLGVERLYLQHGEDLRDPSVSPLLSSSFADLCRTLIVTAEFDGLRIQGEVYGKKLLDAGVDVRAVRYRGVFHAFFDKLGVLPQAEDLVQEIANDILGLFNS